MPITASPVEKLSAPTPTMTPAAPVPPAGSLQQVLLGPAEAADGRTNLFGALARTMAKTGYRDLKEFQRVDLVIGGSGD